MKVKKYLSFQNDISFNDYIPKFIFTCHKKGTITIKTKYSQTCI
jgi:hypothetical protein